MTVCGEKVTGLCSMGKCPHIKRCCPVVWDKYGKIEPNTNEEWIKQCTTEQLAEWICSVHEKCYYCGAKRVSDREHCPFGDGKCRNNKHEFAMWLKQPHTPQKQDDYPCNVKGCSLETRQACCGCPDYFEWEKQHKE